MADNIKLVVYSYATPYRYKDEYDIGDINEIDKKLFLIRMCREIIGYTATNTAGELCREYWDRRARKNYATADDYPDNPSKVWIEKNGE